MHAVYILQHTHELLRGEIHPYPHHFRYRSRASSSLKPLPTLLSESFGGVFGEISGGVTVVPPLFNSQRVSVRIRNVALFANSCIKTQESANFSYNHPIEAQCKLLWHTRLCELQPGTSVFSIVSCIFLYFFIFVSVFIR